MAPSGMTILTPDSGEDRTPPWEVNFPRAVATTCVSSSRDSKSLKNRICVFKSFALIYRVAGWNRNFIALNTVPLLLENIFD